MGRRAVKCSLLDMTCVHRCSYSHLQKTCTVLSLEINLHCRRQHSLDQGEGARTWWEEEQMCWESIQVKYQEGWRPIWSIFIVYTNIEIIKINKWYSFFSKKKKQADQQIELEKGSKRCYLRTREWKYVSKQIKTQAGVAVLLSDKIDFKI